MKGEVRWNQGLNGHSETTGWLLNGQWSSKVEKGELSYKQAQERYGIQGRSTVLVWLRKHGRQNWGPMASYGRMSEPTRSSASSQGPTPEQRIKELEVQLKEAREKSQFFEAVIDVF